jgi:endonuclease G
MCPAGDNRYNWKAMQESFYMTNMCPQDHKLNSGDWNDLEEMCRFWAEKEDGLYVVCGPIVTNKSPKTIGRKQKVVVPDAFFKVILSTSGKQPRALGFIFENKNTRQHLGKYAKSIDEVEALTGINFFPALPDDIEVAVEKQINLRSWGLD